MESIYYNKFRNLMKVLTKFWPGWDVYFSDKDVNIPGHTEKADFYIFCMKECSDVYEARHVEHDMVAGQGVDACKQAVIEIIKEMEEHVLKYREEHGMGGDPYLEYTNYGRDPYGDFVPDYEGNEDNEGEVLESYVEGSDNYPKELAEQRYRVLKEKYLEYKLAKEKEKSKAEEDKANETISADADDNSIINEKPKEMTRDEFQDFVAGVKKDFKKFKEYMKELPAAWPEWEEHFSEMDVNIPGYEETADFYISYMDQCSDVYSLHHLIRDLRPYEDVFKQTLKNIVDTLEPHVKEYLKKLM